MAKTKQETIHVVSTAETGYFYSFRRNRKKTKGDKKLTLMKYDPIAQKTVKFVEKKLSKLRKKGAAAKTEAAAPAEAAAAK